jgi:hypothetical protein
MALILVATVVGLVALPVLADEARPALTVQVSNDASVLVVADPSTHTMAIYRIQGNDVQMITRRDLTKDMNADPGQGAAPASASVPTKDAPGQDPPDFRRPSESVRLTTAHNSDKFKESWDVDYLVPGTVAEVYEKLRGAARDWQIFNERFTGSRAEMQMVRGEVELSIGIFEMRPEGWARVKVQQTRKKN